METNVQCIKCRYCVKVFGGYKRIVKFDKNTPIKNYLMYLWFRIKHFLFITKQFRYDQVKITESGNTKNVCFIKELEPFYACNKDNRLYKDYIDNNSVYCFNSLKVLEAKDELEFRSCCDYKNAGACKPKHIPYTHVSEIDCRTHKE